MLVVTADKASKRYQKHGTGHQGVQKFGQTKRKFAVGRDFSKYEIEKNAFLGP